MGNNDFELSSREETTRTSVLSATEVHMGFVRRGELVLAVFVRLLTLFVVPKAVESFWIRDVLRVCGDGVGCGADLGTCG